MGAERPAGTRFALQRLPRALLRLHLGRHPVERRALWLPDLGGGAGADLQQGAGRNAAGELRRACATRCRAGRAGQEGDPVRLRRALLRLDPACRQRRLPLPPDRGGLGRRRHRRQQRRGPAGRRAAGGADRERRAAARHRLQHHGHTFQSRRGGRHDQRPLGLEQPGAERHRLWRGAAAQGGRGARQADVRRDGGDDQHRLAQRFPGRGVPRELPAQ